MSQRNIRVNELIKREVSEVLHTRYQQESVYITITEVDVSPDHRKAHVFFSVIGDQERARVSLKWLQKNQREIRHQVGKRIVLKHLPHLQFHFDPSIQRGNHILQMLDELDEELPPQ
jgi:ribosome-binding factor A